MRVVLWQGELADVGHLVDVQGSVHFIAASLGGRSLWRTDGTRSGTMEVPGTPRFTCVETDEDVSAFCDHVHEEVVPVSDALFVLVEAGLWRVGADGGQLEVASDLLPGDLIAADSRLYFKAADEAHGFELWSVGTGGEPPTLVRDINPGPADGPCPVTGGDFCLDQIAGMSVLDDHVLFAADDGTHGLEPWVSDGTPAGTRMLRDIVPGSRGGGCPREEDLPLFCRGSFFTTVRRTVYFWATDRRHGAELWRTDGTTAGTRLVRDLRPGRRGSHVFGGLMAGARDRLFFTADDGAGTALWTTDGTAAGTVRVTALPTGEDAWFSDGEAVALRGSLLFVHDDGVHGEELWRSDGTAAGTELVADLAPGRKDAGITSLVATRSMAWFTTTRSSDPDAIWRTDGTAAGTFPVVRVRAEPSTEPCRRCDPGQPRDLLISGGRLFFTADDSIHGRTLWVVRPLPRTPVSIPILTASPSSAPGDETSTSSPAPGSQAGRGPDGGRRAPVER